jgi:hypothetical protein
MTVVLVAFVAASCAVPESRVDRATAAPPASAPGGPPQTVAEVGPVPSIPTRGALLSEAPPEMPPPAAISFPSLGSLAPVVPVGIAGDELDVPPTADVVGWYRAGRVPGESEGSAVLAGHVDYDGRRGAFFRLADLRVGDPIEVTDAAGSITSFVVTGSQRYPKAELPTGELFRRDGASTLTLITCGGKFRPAVGSYADNVVVRAERSSG